MNLAALTNSTILVVAVTYGLLLRLSTFAGLFGWPLRLLVLLSLCRFAYAVLRDTASGHRQLPAPGIETMNPIGGSGVVLHALLFAVLLYWLFTTPWLSGAGGELLRAVGLAVVVGIFPASAAVMGMTSNLTAAVTPASLVSLIRDLGSDYFKLVLVAGALVLAAAFAENAWGASLLLGWLADVVAAWVCLALFLSIGSALRGHRDDFDLVESLDDADQRAERERQSAWQRTLDRAYGSIRGGLPNEGYRTIKELLASERDSLDIYQWTFNRMLAWDEPRHAVLLGERFAARLWEAGRKIDALELVQQCKRLSPTFALPAPQAAELAAYAREIGRHGIADDLASVRADLGGV